MSKKTGKEGKYNKFMLNEKNTRSIRKNIIGVHMFLEKHFNNFDMIIIDILIINVQRLLAYN